MGNRYKLLTLALTALAAINGCSSMNNTQRDALAGGGIGAAIGALVDRRHPGTGAAIGGLSGAALGAAVGNSEDHAERRAQAAAAAASAPVVGPLSYEEIVTMAKSGTADSVIINQIRTIIWLQQNGVSEAVIREMQDTNRRYAHPVVVRDPYFYGPVYVAPPPPVVGFGVVAHVH